MAFNGGEISPELSLRSDLDVFQRAAQSLVNFDVSQMGGIRRRRGMMAFCPALERSRLVPYVYSQEERFLVEGSLDAASAAVLAEFDAEFGEYSAGGGWGGRFPAMVRIRRAKALVRVFISSLVI